MARDLINETQTRSMPIKFMKPKSLWEQFLAQRRMIGPAVPLPIQSKTPKPFQPLTRQQSIEILDDSIQWLIDETRATLAMPSGPSKDRRWTELQGRNKSFERDFERFIRSRE